MSSNLFFVCVKIMEQKISKDHFTFCCRWNRLHLVGQNRLGICMSHTEKKDWEGGKESSYKGCYWGGGAVGKLQKGVAFSYWLLYSQYYVYNLQRSSFLSPWGARRWGSPTVVDAEVLSWRGKQEYHQDDSAVLMPPAGQETCSKYTQCTSAEWWRNLLKVHSVYISWMVKEPA